jgi:hypothetical protein
MSFCLSVFLSFCLSVFLSLFISLTYLLLELRVIKEGIEVTGYRGQDSGRVGLEFELGFELGVSDGASVDVLLIEDD